MSATSRLSQHQGLFITGTDTEIGKTWASVALMTALKNEGFRVAGMKPIASGCVRVNGEWRNDDALLIQQHATISHDYQTINPFAFEPPVSPNFAAADATVTIDPAVIAENYQALSKSVDFTIVEGIGGWRVPFDTHLSAVDLVRNLGLPVIMVVGFRLGCINHALLTIEALVADGVKIAGWIANHLIADYSRPQETLDLLGQQIPAPLIGELPCLGQFQAGVLGDAINLRNLRV